MIIVVYYKKTIIKKSHNISTLKEDQHGFRPELMNERFVCYILKRLDESEQEIDALKKSVESLKAELREKNKLPKKPILKASKLDNDPNNKEEEKKKKSRTTGKRNKKGSLNIHEIKEIKIEGLSKDWKLIGYKKQIRQDIIVQAYNVEYRLEKWKSTNGEIQIAQMPKHLQNTHFGSTLKSFIIHQYYECGVTQPLIYSSLKDYGIDISTGQINTILNSNNASFHAEKEELLKKAIALNVELRTDDTGARHNFKNGFCNCINSELFTYFKTTHSKSRINFLEILRQSETDYIINETALSYLNKEKYSSKYHNILQQSYELGERIFKNKEALTNYMVKHAITAKYVIKQITEALLIGSIVEHGFNPKTVIHSDGAGQFNLFIHALCWKHAERPLIKLKHYNKIQENQLYSKQNEYWLLYHKLKGYKTNPSKTDAIKLNKQFDQLCEPITNYAALNQVLQKIKSQKQEMLVVLHIPSTSLHNNNSECDIREYAKRRKLSAGTRSENGRLARDTFLSLKKTCRKLNISFWKYLQDRIQNSNQIPPLIVMMEHKHNLSLG
jgi:hypothetical protein